jgi:lysozyme
VNKAGLAASVAAAIAAAAGVVLTWEPAPGEARLKAYRDFGGVWTICDGHTKGVRPGMVVTHEQCDQWRVEDLQEANTIVDRCIYSTMNAHQRAALISFAFNVGPGGANVKDGLCILKNGREPYIRRMANAGRWQEACDGLLAWTKAAGIELRGLVKRRQQERALCLRPDFSNVIGGST